MNGIAISKFVGFFAVSKFLGNLYLSEQIFNRKRSLGAPEDGDDYEVILVSHHTKLEYLKHNFTKPAVKLNLGKIADQLPQIFFDS